MQGGLTSRSDVFHVLVHSPKVTAKDGPSARLRQVDSMTEFPGVVTDMFRRLQHDLGLWFHHVREVWRQAQYGHALLEIVLLSRGFSKVFFNPISVGLIMFRFLILVKLLGLRTRTLVCGLRFFVCFCQVSW